MADVRFNPPGCNLEESFWRELKRSDVVEAATFSKGESIVPAQFGDEELIFIRAGAVACDIPDRGRTARRLWLGRGDKFQPTKGRGAPSYRAVVKVSAWRISKRRAGAVVWGQLGAQIGNLVALDTWLLDAVRAFRTVPILSRVAPRQVLELLKLEGMAVVLEHGGDSLSPQQQPGFYYVAKGNAETVARREEAPPTGETDGRGFRECCRVLPEGALYSGPLDIVAHDETAVIVLLPDLGIERFIRTSVGFRRALRDDCRPERVLPNFVLVVGRAETTPLDEITALVAESVAEDFEEKVLIVRLAPHGETAFPEVHRATGVEQIRVELASFRYDDERFIDQHTVFILVPERLRARATYKELADRALEMQPGPARTDTPLTILFISEAAFADEPTDLHPLRDCRRRRVVLLGGSQADEDPSYPAQTIRVRLNLEEIRRLNPVSLARLPNWMRGSIARIGRAVTDREVGVALSGGGAWTFAHLALLEAMHEQGIPIDMVSGASGGSLVAAYYCARGLDGLALLRKAVGKLDLAALFAVVSSRAFAWPVELDLEGRRLRDLDVPLFPIVADLDAGAEYVPRRGGLKLSECVRASSSLVPLTTRTKLEGRRCVDGVFVNNTGERVLAEEGADLIVASDVVQAPGDARSGGLLDLVYRVNRIRDTTDATYLLTQTADLRDAFLASCRFHPEQLPTTPMFFSIAQFNESVARPQAEKFVTDTVRPLWDKLRAP